MKGNFKPAISMNGRFRRIALKNGWTTAELISNHDAMAQSMMGERQVQQDALFYEFSLERMYLRSILLRSIASLSSTRSGHTRHPFTVRRGRLTDRALAGPDHESAKVSCDLVAPAFTLPQPAA
jgi:hypothetical protein